MKYENHISNEAIRDKEKFKELFVLSAKLMHHTKREEYSFFTEEALMLFDEMKLILKDMGFTDDYHINNGAFKINILHTMSIILMMQQDDNKISSSNRNFNSNNVVDFLAYKNKKREKLFMKPIHTTA